MFYWVYNISSLAFALMTVSVFAAFGIGGVVAGHWLEKRRGRYWIADNDVVGFFFAAVVGFYGITLGLISVGVWQTFSDADNKVSQESVAIESLFRNFNGYPEPMRDELRGRLVDYTRFVIDIAWPSQRAGKRASGGTERFSAIQDLLYAFEPKNMRDMALHQETLHQFNRLSEMRRLRSLSVSGGLPATIWWVVIVGAAASIALTWMFTVEDVSRHLLLTGSYAALIGLLIFLVAALDNPYRGEYSVGSDAYELVLERMQRIQKK